MEKLKMDDGPTAYETQICNETDLVTFLSQGWSVLHSYHRPDSKLSYTGSMPVEVVVLTPMFVVGRTSKERMFWLESQLRYARDKERTTGEVLREVKNKLELLERKLEYLASDAQALQQSADNATKEAADAEKRAYEAVELKNRLERDLAKVRSAIGDLKFNEIVNPKAT